MSMTLPSLELGVNERDFNRSAAKLERAIRFAESDITNTLVDTVTEVINYAKILVSIPYPPPSQPNQPPHMRTGRLQESIDIFQISNYYVDFGADASYARALEYGTSKMRPRPFMTPSVLALIDKFPELVFRKMEEIFR